ncbi:putative protein OS=Bosea thiooxidans OX=53254 GN=SAMN05660750_03332 PE=4 SV=1 [Bosea thiooxidans]|uniref:Uncharacterized protein n=1 Tax=Bosea thiooxidans TaxID=53254 RepID=A0A1T5FLL8_9HYPH|nr:hypothetical protein [Bosea thiooxidans]SKB96986.1 hypothetical protein SAMN05660750_03332 [Bosea thiooxidans]
MPKAPLYTVTNPAKEPRFAMIGVRKEPIDAGLSKELAISAETALALVGQGFKVTDPDGKAVAGKKAKAD